ncbi:hypothetical protein [Streptomyces sp. NPDC047042]|uniref:hypothetical protein n=1 Tax=Streptomyces sp. NPDC047042 TaxID=3154807 RepID=UPI0033DF36EF
MTSTPSHPNTPHEQRLDHLGELLLTREVRLAAWGNYIDLPDTPKDSPQAAQSYGQRLSRRDADMWSTVAPIRAFVREMISIARAQKKQVDEAAYRSNTSHWYSQLNWSEEALDQLDALEEDYCSRLDNLPSSAAAGTPEYDALIDERNAKAWYAIRNLSLYVSAVGHVHEHFQRYMPRAEDRAFPPVPAPSRDTTRRPHQ